MIQGRKEKGRLFPSSRAMSHFSHLAYSRGMSVRFPLWYEDGYYCSIVVG